MQRIVSLKADGAFSIRLPQAALCLLIAVLYFQPTIGAVFKGFFLADMIAGYADEAVALFFMFYFLYFIARFPVGRFEIGLAAFSAGVLILGGLSGAIYQLQKFVPSLIDAFGFIKFSLTLAGANCFFRRNRFQAGFFFCMRNIVRLLVILYPLLTVLNLFFHIFPDGGFRWFMRAQVLFHRHPADLALTCIFSVLFLYDTDMDRKNLLPMLTLSLIGMSALRAKECAVIVVFWALYLYFIVLKRRKIFPILLFASLGIVLIGIRSFFGYYGTMQSARAALAFKAVEIANDFFPLGAGFGSYATGQSGVYYSKIYYLYNLNHVWGLTKEKPNFMADTFWPAIVGELGWGGFLLFAWLFLTLIMKCLSIRSHPRYFVASLCVFNYLMLSTLSSQSLIGGFGVICALLLAYFWNVGSQKSDMERLLT